MAYSSTGRACETSDANTAKIAASRTRVTASALISQGIVTSEAAEPSANLRWALCVTYSVFTDLKLWGSRVFILNQHVSSNRQDPFVAHACRRRGANRTGCVHSAGACVLRP